MGRIAGIQGQRETSTRASSVSTPQGMKWAPSAGGTPVADSVALNSALGCAMSQNRNRDTPVSDSSTGGAPWKGRSCRVCTASVAQAGCVLGSVVRGMQESQDVVELLKELSAAGKRQVTILLLGARACVHALAPGQRQEEEEEEKDRACTRPGVPGVPGMRSAGCACTRTRA